MDSEELSLSWSNHRDVLMSVFDDLLSNNSFVDCTIAAEGQCLRAHKVVLSASSPYFQLMFSQDCEKHPIIFLKDVKFIDLKAIIEFVYRGEVKIKESQLGGFLEVANSLQIRGLNGIMKNAESQRTILPDSPPSKRKRKNSEPFLPEHDTCDSPDLPLDYNPANNVNQSSNRSTSDFLEPSGVAGSSRLESCDVPPKVQSEFLITESVVKEEPEFDIMEGTEFLDASMTEKKNTNDASESATVPANQRGSYVRASNFLADRSAEVAFPWSSQPLTSPLLNGVPRQTFPLQCEESLPPEDSSLRPDWKAKGFGSFSNVIETPRRISKKPKQMRIGCDNKCRLKCVFKISTSDRLAQFTAFQSLRNTAERYQYINSVYVMKSLERSEGKFSSLRKSHIARIFTLISGGKPLKVCRTMFLDTFCISNSWLYTMDYRNAVREFQKKRNHIAEF